MKKLFISLTIMLAATLAYGNFSVYKFYSYGVLYG